MNITVSNYLDQTRGMDFTAFPEPLQKGHSIIERGGLRMYDKSDGIKRTIDLYLVELNKKLAVQSTPKPPEEKKPAPAAKPKNMAELKRYLKPGMPLWFFHRYKDKPKSGVALQERKVSKVGSDSISFFREDGKESWLRPLPKASEITFTNDAFFIDMEGIEMNYFYDYNAAVAFKWPGMTEMPKRDFSILNQYKFDSGHPITLIDRSSSQFNQAFDQFLDEIKKYGDRRPGYWEKIGAKKPTGNFKLSVIKTAPNKFVYAGSVPNEIAFIDATRDQIQNAQYGGKFGPKTRVFETKKEAVDFAEKHGYTVDNYKTKASFKPKKRGKMPSFKAIYDKIVPDKIITDPTTISFIRDIVRQVWSASAKAILKKAKLTPNFEPALITAIQQAYNQTIGIIDGLADHAKGNHKAEATKLLKSKAGVLSTHPIYMKYFEYEVEKNKKPAPAPAPAKAAPKAKAAKPKKAAVKAKAKAPVKAKPKVKIVVKTVKEPKAINTKKVFSKELQLLKRFVGMNGQTKSVAAIESLNKAVTSALAAGSITDHKSEINHIKESTDDFLKKMKSGSIPNAQVDIKPDTLDKMKAAIANAKERLRVSYLSGTPKPYKKNDSPAMIVYDSSLGSIETELPEIKVRAIRTTRKDFEGVVFTNSKSVADFIRKIYSRGELLTQEHFMVIYLDHANKPIGYYRHSKGAIAATVADIKMILGVGLKLFASSIMVAHNHPSGNLNESVADVQISRRLKEAAKQVELQVLDSLIITKDGYTSLADKGLMGLSGLKHSGGNGEKKPVRAASSHSEKAQPKGLPMIEGFIRSDHTPEKVPGTFRLKGPIGDFLGDQQRFKLAITLSGQRGAGKTWFSTDLINAFINAGYTVGMFSIEQGGMESKDTKAAIDHNVSPKNKPFLAVTGEAKDGIDTVKKFADRFDVIVIDSWQKIGLPNTDFDRLRQEHPNTIWIVIFQLNADGGMRNGVAAEFDAPVVLKAISIDPTGKHNYITAEKNRGNRIDQKYMIHAKEVKPLEEVKEVEETVA